MKRISMKIKALAAVMTLILTLTVIPALADGTTDRLDEIKERGYLIVGTEGTWSPYTYHDEDDNLVGFDVEVAKLIADYIGVDVQYSETVWSSIFASLDADKIDMVVNEVSYSEELAPADNPDINSLADIAGKIAANDATSSIGQLALDSGATLDPVGEMAQSISEVLSGRADLTLNNTVAFTDYLKQHPESEDKVRIIVATDPAPSGYIPVMKGNDKLLAAINEALDKAREDGTLSELSLKYFGVDITKEADDAEATQTPAE